MSDRITTVCFHGIGKPGRGLEPGEERFWIDVERYHEILDVLSAAGCRVEITFDDGNASDHDHALSALVERGLTAEFFVIAGRLGQPGSLGPDQLQELALAGMGIGNHGLEHLSWRDVRDDDALEHEIEAAASTIEDVIGTRPEHAACPRGSYDRRVLTMLRRHGYRRVYTVDEGASWSRSWLRSRYTVIAQDTPKSIRSLLESPDGGPRRRLVRSARGVVKRWR